MIRKQHADVNTHANYIIGSLAFTIVGVLTWMSMVLFYETHSYHNAYARFYRKMLWAGDVTTNYKLLIFTR